MLNRVVQAVIVAVVVTLACLLLGAVLAALKIDIAVTVGDFLRQYAGVLGVLAGLWHYFAGGDFLNRSA